MAPASSTDPSSGSPIKIDGPVTVLDRPYFHPGGPIGGLAGEIIYKDEPDRISDFVRKQKIPLADMVRTAFERQINLLPGATERLKSFGPASFRVFVIYGITSVPFSDYRPYLLLRLELVDSDGKILWKGHDYTGGHGSAKPIPYADFFQSPEVFIDEFQAATNETVALVVKQFQ